MGKHNCGFFCDPAAKAALEIIPLKMHFGLSLHVPGFCITHAILPCPDRGQSVTNTIT